MLTGHVAQKNNNNNNKSDRYYVKRKQDSLVFSFQFWENSFSIFTLKIFLVDFFSGNHQLKYTETFMGKLRRIF